MKAFQIISLIATVIITACGNNNSAETTKQKTDTTSQNTNTNTESQKTASVNELVTAYLNVKNALTKDDGKQAAVAANEMNTALTNIDGSGLSSDQMKVYDDVKDDIKEHSEHIESNGSNIAHQREHFDLISQDMIDLIKAIGSSKTLYNDYCPMYNNKKGASWLSETKEIQNPYYGKKMAKCGEVKEEIKAKG